MYNPYTRFSNFFTQLDTTAKNTLGAIYSPPANPTGIVAAGYGAQPVYKYVFYNSTINPAPEIAPAPVYWADETFTVVTGQATEAYQPTANTIPNGASGAGYLGPNTTGYVGLTAAILNQSYCWIQVGGLLPGAFEPTTQTSTTFANPIFGVGSGAWTSACNTTITNSTRAFGVLWGTIGASGNGTVDVLVGGYPGVFWGS